MDAHNNQKVKKKWRKILYEKQPYPDNFVPPIFLEELRTNGLFSYSYLPCNRLNDYLICLSLSLSFSLSITKVNLKRYHLTQVIIDSGLVSQGISVVIIFIAVYGLFYFGNESESQLICFYITVTTLLLYLMQFMLSSWANGKKVIMLTNMLKINF